MLPVKNSALDKIPAKEVNLYYYNSGNVERNKVDTFQTTNQVLSLNSLTSASTSTVIITPQGGLSHVILSATLPAHGAVLPGGTVNYSGCGLPRGWLFRLIDRVLVRYPGSQDVILTGSELEICALINAGSAAQKQDIMNLAGQAMNGASSGAGQFVGDALTAAIPLTFPHCSSESGSEVRAVLPTEMFSSGITVNITFKPFSQVFGIADANANASIPSQFAEAFVQTRQLLPLDRSQLMKMGPNQAYMYPCKYYQVEGQYQIQSSATLNPAGDGASFNIVGIKAGQVRNIYMWITATNPTTANNELLKANGSQFVPIKSCTATYSGTVLHRYSSGSAVAQLLDTLYSDTGSYVEVPQVDVDTTNNIWIPDAQTPIASSQWLDFPMGMRFEKMSDRFTIVNGVDLASSAITISDLKVTADGYDSSNIYTVHWMVALDAVMKIADGVVSYEF